MKPVVLNLLAISTLAVSLAACAPTSDVATGSPAANRDQCFYVNDVRSHITPNDDVMVVETGRNRSYALTIAPACIGLDNAGRIGLRTRGGGSRICGPFDAEVLYAEFGDARLRRCNITDVKALTQAEADALTGADKAKKHKTDKTLAKEAEKEAKPAQ